MNGVNKNNSICDRCGHKGALVAGKKYCSDCRLCCLRECVACHKLYNNLKYFDGDSLRCKSCTVKNIMRKANRKCDKTMASSPSTSRPSKRLLIEADIADSDDGGVFSGKRPSEEGPVRKKKKVVTIKQDMPTEEDDDEDDNEYEDDDDDDDDEDDNDERGGGNSDARSVTSSPLTILDNESVEEAPPPPPPPPTMPVVVKKKNKKRKEGEHSLSKGEAYAKNVFALMKDAALESKKSKVKKACTTGAVSSGKTENPLVSGPVEKKKRTYRKKVAATKTRAQCEKEFVHALFNLNAADPKQTHVNVFFYPSNYKVPEQ